MNSPQPLPVNDSENQPASVSTDQLLARQPVGSADELDWLEDAQRAMLSQNPVRSRGLLYSLVLVVVALLGWASWAEIDEVTRGSGKVIPSRQIQLVQSQDGGLVTELAVNVGDEVEAGQLLVRLDATRFAASWRESQVNLLALQIKAARLSATIAEQPFEPVPEWQAQAAEVLAQEQQLYRSRLAALAASREIASQQLAQQRQALVEAKAQQAQLRRGVQFAGEELRVTRPLVSSGAVSRVELLRLEREHSTLRGEKAQADARQARLTAAVAEAQQRITEVSLEFKNTVREELSQVTAQLNALNESSQALSDRVTQTAVRSPVRGTIKQLHYNTIGGVVLPGKTVVEVVPLDDALLLEARISPRDIAFISPGQPALVKFTAYDFVVYGGLEANVEHIGADTVTDEDGKPFYQVKVRTRRASLGEGLPIIPGMVAQVDILTGKKTILDYLLKPVLRARQYALTER